MILEYWSYIQRSVKWESEQVQLWAVSFAQDFPVPLSQVTQKNYVAISHLISFKNKI